MIDMILKNGMFFDEIQSYFDNTDFGEIKLDFYIGDISKIEVLKNTCFLSSANSFGYMDGGIDETYSSMFNGIQQKVQNKIKNYPFKTCGGNPYIPIGSSILIPLNEIFHINKCFLISAPTMFRPSNITTTNNAYIAMLSTMSLIKKYNNSFCDKDKENRINTLICPMLCTGYGGMSFKQSSIQIKKALLDFINGNIIKGIELKDDIDCILCDLEVQEDQENQENKIKVIN